MRFRARLISLLLLVILTIAALLGTGWFISKQLLNSLDTAYQEGQQLSHLIDQTREAQVNFQRQVQEWKNILLRGYDSKLKNKHMEGFQKREKQMHEGLLQVRQSLLDLNMPDAARQATDLIAAHETLGRRYRTALFAHPDLSATDQQAIDAMVRGMDRPTSSGIDTLVESIQKASLSRFVDEAAQVKQAAQQRQHMILLAAVVMAFILGFGLITLLRSLLRSLGADPEDVVAATSRIASGDLTQQLNASQPNSLLGSLEMMQLRLRNINLAIDAVAQDIKTHTEDLPHSEAREALELDVDNMMSAIRRIKIQREGEQA
jgi:flagellar basal body-associated protein FliL